jgi:hypothetical protein
MKNDLQEGQQRKPYMTHTHILVLGTSNYDSFRRETNEGRVNEIG